MCLSQQIRKGLCAVFPATSKGPKKSYISSEAWDIRKTRIFCRKFTRGLYLRAHKLTLWGVWGHLAAKGRYSRTKVLVQGLIVAFRLLYTRKLSAALTKSLGKCLRRDRAAALNELAKQISSMTAREFATALKAVGVVNPKKPSGVKPLPRLTKLLQPFGGSTLVPKKMESLPPLNDSSIAANIASRRHW